MRKGELVRSSLSLLVLAVLTVSLPACLLLIPAAIVYFQTEDGYVATVDVRVSAEKVWEKAVGEAEAIAAQNPNMKILKRDDSKRTLELTDGKETAVVKVAEEGPMRTEIIVMARMPKGETKIEREKEFAFRIINRISDSLGVSYKIVEK